MSKLLKVVAWVAEELPLGQGIEQIKYAKTSQELLRYLVEERFDLVVIQESRLSNSQIKNIRDLYGLPFVSIGKGSEKLLDGIGMTSQDCFGQWVREFHQDILIANYEKQIKNNQIYSSKLKSFDEKIFHVERKSFVVELSRFLKKFSCASDSFWLNLPVNVNQQLELDFCRAQLNRQKVVPHKTVDILKNCRNSVFEGEKFKIWRQNSGGYLAIFWFDGKYRKSQCLILTGVRHHSLTLLCNFFEMFVPFINRRWRLCLELQEAQELVFRDSLTNLFNQKFLMEILEKKIDEYRRYTTPFTVLFIDVDFFKKVNDTNGHIVGSQVLVELGQLLGSMIRSTDYAFRYGGDEFILLLSHAEGDGAHAVAERIRYKVENESFLVHGVDVKVTVSIGLASFPKHATSATGIVKIADEAMYYGKNKSRNIVYKVS